jgi:hypothetical protein
MDANLLHISYEGGGWKTRWEPEEDMWRWTVSPEKAPDAPQYIELTYRKGDIVAIDGERMSPATVLTPEPAGRQARHRSSRSGGKPLCRHEEPRLLRNPGRHHHAEGRTAPLNPSRWTAKWPT